MSNQSGGTLRTLQTTLEFFTSQFTRWRDFTATEEHLQASHEVKVYDDLLRTVCDMDAVCLFSPDQHCLCHVDLFPRNIMVKKVQTEEKESIQVTGILDWDEAVFAPKFVSCEPPAWLWQDNFDRVGKNSIENRPVEVESAINSVASTSDKQELKCIFEENAGDEYMALAYGEASRLGRRLFRIATNGFHGTRTSGDNYLKAAERIVTEWKVLQQSLS